MLTFIEPEKETFCKQCGKSRNCFSHNVLNPIQKKKKKKKGGPRWPWIAHLNFPDDHSQISLLGGFKEEF